jgi:uncharacterized protein YdaU (DUF1376 family)
VAKAPAFQMYASDFLVDTNDWTVDEVGIYLRLLLSEWVNGALPNDEKRLSRIAGCNYQKFKKKWSVIASKFEQNGNQKLINKRLELEREKQDKYRELQSEKGKMGGRPQKSRSFPPALTEQKPEESSSSSSSFSFSKKNKTYSEIFLNFWDQYPNKKGKWGAFKAWNKHQPDMTIIINALNAQKEEKGKLLADRKFCPEWPNASTWLNGKRWEDEVKEIKTQQPTEHKNTTLPWIEDAIKEGWKDG